jgi:predicted TIM-barrel fold metal-dependent hydrolase
MRIDAHVHYTPPALAKDLARFAAQEPYWGLLLQPAPGRRSIQGWATAEQMIEDMDRAGLDKVVLMGEYFQQHERCLARNDQALALVRRWPERVMAFAVLQPRAGQPALDELKRCAEAGLRGVGELNPYAQGYELADPDFLRVVETCLAYDLPLNLHVSEEVGPYYPGKSTTPLRHYYDLACRYPDLKLILAHWGGGLIFYELMPQVRRSLKNVWYDTAASPLLYPTGRILKVALDCLDHRKILYGSDYPLLIYPRRQAAPDFRPFIDELQALQLDEDIYDDIMGHNAARLLGLLEPGHREDDIPQQAASPLETGFQPKPGGRDWAGKVTAFMAVKLVAEVWPQTQPIFERFGIPWQDKIVPAWEPVSQAAAAQGWGPQDQQRLLDELNAVITD